ncbi:hypothetical protein LEN26_005443 [Aphanomyces euteiches]|nr:hypothetical protein AeMF1_000380 [Aphanomyces euteiches]KAH9138045.1 hypothetical protein LEN26_005443 [Aphanomyces euteiches]
MAVEDPRVLDACVVLNEKTPTALLHELQAAKKISPVKNKETAMGPLTHRQFKCILMTGCLIAKGFASSKKNAKQRAAQAMLKQFHPTTEIYFELLRKKGFMHLKQFK